MTKILLVDDHKMILDSLQLLFNLMSGIEVVNSAYDSRSVMGILEKEKVDVVITDYKMPFINGLELTRLIKKSYPEIKVLILSINEDSRDIQDAFSAGASGYLMKKANRKDLEEAVRTVAEGRLYFGQEAMRAVLLRSDSHGESDDVLRLKVSSLTKREIEIVELLAEEYSSSEIGARLNISTGTVESHRHNILRKLDVKSTIGVIKFALKSGIVKP